MAGPEHGTSIKRAFEHVHRSAEKRLPRYRQVESGIIVIADPGSAIFLEKSQRTKRIEKKRRRTKTRNEPTKSKPNP